MQGPLLIAWIFKETNSLFPSKVIAKLERTLISTSQQKKGQTQKSPYNMTLKK